MTSRQLAELLNNIENYPQSYEAAGHTDDDQLYADINALMDWAASATGTDMDTWLCKRALEVLAKTMQEFRP